jgi:hypothetical protein
MSFSKRDISYIAFAAVVVYAVVLVVSTLRELGAS